MNTADVEMMLRRRDFTLSSTSETAVERLPEAPGVYALLAQEDAACLVLGVWAVRDPWLRTDVATRLATPAVAAHRPHTIAYRVMEPEPGDGVLRHRARLVAEQAEVVEALRLLP